MERVLCRLDFIGHNLHCIESDCFLIFNDKETLSNSEIKN